LKHFIEVRNIARRTIQRAHPVAPGIDSNTHHTYVGLVLKVFVIKSALTISSDVSDMTLNEPAK